MIESLTLSGMATESHASVVRGQRTRYEFLGLSVVMP